MKSSLQFCTARQLISTGMASLTHRQQPAHVEARSITHIKAGESAPESIPKELFRNTTVCLQLSIREVLRTFQLPDKTKTVASKGTQISSTIQPNIASWEGLVLPSIIQLLHQTLFPTVFSLQPFIFIHQIYISHSILSSFHCIILQWKLSLERIFNTLFLHKASRLYYLCQVINNFLFSDTLNVFSPELSILLLRFTQVQGKTASSIF